MAEKKSVLTLNLGSQRVGAARFGVGGKGSLTLREYAFVSMPGDPTVEGTRRAAVEAAAGSLVKHLKATGGETNFAIPGHQLIAKFVKLPPIAEDKVDEIVTFEAKGAIPFPLNEAAWDYQLMGKKVGEVEAVIVAAKGEQVEDLNRSVEAAGLSARIVDGAPIALYNAFRYNYPDITEPSLLLDLGARTTNLIFIDGARTYITSGQIGGATLTQAIAKELGVDYDTAEQRKVTEGFVNLGGNYADHEDPEVDTISKVIRNTVLKIDGDVRRRTTAYRQQGGNAPVRAFICGAGASLPYLKEVLEEKLGLPVEYFNPLRNVGVGPKVDVEAVKGEAHLLGELVGLALREMACPIELDLAPKSVQASRDIGSRKPFLITAAAALFATLGGCWLTNKGGAGAFEKKADEVKTRLNSLQGFASQISAKDVELEKLKKRSEYLSNAVRDRYFWAQLLNDLGSSLKDENMWLTQVTTFNKTTGKELSPKLWESSESANPFMQATVKTPGSPVSGTKPNAVDHLMIAGVNRKMDSSAPGNYDTAAVVELFREIIKHPRAKEYFEIDEKAKDIETSWINNNTQEGSVLDGYPFQIMLPLKRPIEVQTAPAGR